MTPPGYAFQLEQTDGAARAGTLTLPHGTVRTPCFMPVGTHGVVRGLSMGEVEETRAQIILSNTYHLHLRPGEGVVRALGGLHRFTGWKRPMLTDSGGFQVFSLEGMRKIEESGVTFQSHVDGSKRHITPESAMEIQWELGADIAMQFDHVVPGASEHALAEVGMERSLRWLDRCLARHEVLRVQGDEDPGGIVRQQTMWPIIQGGIHNELRLRSLDGILSRADWTGVAIGGLSVGEPKPTMHRVLELLEPRLPSERPRYLMGVGFPEDLIHGIARGVDLFDCVAATRNGRHGTAWITDGKVNVRKAAFRTSDEPLDAECDCRCCTTVSRGYLRHLFVVQDMLALRLVSLHNIRFLIRLAETARAHVLSGTYASWSASWLARYHGDRTRTTD